MAPDVGPAPPRNSRSTGKFSLGKTNAIAGRHKRQEQQDVPNLRRLGRRGRHPLDRYRHRSDRRRRRRSLFGRLYSVLWLLDWPHRLFRNRRIWSNPALAAVGAPYLDLGLGNWTGGEVNTTTKDTISYSFSAPLPAGVSFTIDDPGASCDDDTGPYTFTVSATYKGAAVSTAGWSFVVESPTGANAGLHFLDQRRHRRHHRQDPTPRTTGRTRSSSSRRTRRSPVSRSSGRRSPTISGR